MSPFTREGPITILRVTEGTIDKTTGRYGPETTEQFTLLGNLQPISGEDLVRAEEGARLHEMKTMFLHEELDEKDIVLYKNEKYQVQLTQEWDPSFSPNPHYRYKIELMGDNY